MKEQPQGNSRYGEMPMSVKTNLVGRDGELKQLNGLLRSRGDRHAFYVYGEGGLGKTRLLEELQKLVHDAGTDYLTSGIIDLYHTDTHSITDVQLSIVNGLDPKLKHFPRYRRSREDYVRKREQGVDPYRLENQRSQLTEVFVEEFNRLALDSRKIVLCFDTVEQLQYQSSAVEDRARVDRAETTRLKPWLLKTLPQLHNALIVFAGRPGYGTMEQTVSPHERFVDDLERSFKQELTLVQLRPLTVTETQDFVCEIPGASGVIPEDLIPLLHRLTGGRPIFLHLALDLVLHLSPVPREVLALFRSFSDLISVADDDPRLAEARATIETAILTSIFNDAGAFGGYLGHIALLPKGVNEQIIQDTIGMPPQEASELLRLLEPLSFVKMHAPPRRFLDTNGNSQALNYAGQLLFLQDEMYALLTRPGVMRNLRMQERWMAKSVMSLYYDARIQALEQSINDEQDPGQRAHLRRELERLQVDRLYYLLVQDVHKGYQEYRDLTDRANRERRVGFAMRLRDEFMRFYSTPQRRQQFLDAGMDEKRVEREAMLMWVERFHWWARQGEVIDLAERIVSDPTQFSITEADIAIQANIQALLIRNRQMMYGPEPAVAGEAQTVWERLDQAGDSSEAGMLARARLATSIGWQLDDIGLLKEAADYYRKALVAFRMLDSFPDEQALLLNNMSYLYARQGQGKLARIWGREATAINEGLRMKYSSAMSLSTWSNIEMIQGSYLEAESYAQIALSLFHEIEDGWGTAMALRTLAQAKRGQAKSITGRGRKQQQAEAYEQIEEHLLRASATAAESNLQGLLHELQLDLGRAYCESGNAVDVFGSHETAIPYFKRSAASFFAALTGAVSETKPEEKDPQWWKHLLEGQEAEAKDAQTPASEFLAARIEARAELGQLLLGLHAEKGSHHQLMQAETELPVEHLGVQDGQRSRLPGRFLVAAGKVEWLRGSLALLEGAADALRHFARAFEYFDHFSPVSAEKDQLVEYVYDNLRDVPAERQQSLMAALQSWVDAQSDRQVVVEFTAIMKELVI